MTDLATSLTRIQDRQKVLRRTEWLREQTRAQIHLLPEVHRLLNSAFGPMRPNGTGRGSDCRIDVGHCTDPASTEATFDARDITLCVTLHQQDLAGITPERLAHLIEAAGEEAGLSYDATDDEVTFSIATSNRSTQEVTAWAEHLLKAAKQPLGHPGGEAKPTNLRKEARLKGDANLSPETLLRELDDRLSLLMASAQTPSIRSAPNPESPFRLAGIQRGVVAFQKAKMEAERSHFDRNAVSILADALRRLRDEDAETPRCGMTPEENSGFHEVLEHLEDAILRGIVHRLGPLSTLVAGYWEHAGDGLPPFWLAPGGDPNGLGDEPLNEEKAHQNPFLVETLQSRTGVHLSLFSVDGLGRTNLPTQTRKPYFEVWAMAHTPATRWEPENADPVLIWSGTCATTAFLEWHKEHLRQQIPTGE